MNTRKASTSSTKGGVTIEDFNIKALLGKGSYGEVFLVQKKGSEKEYALKTMEKVHMNKEKKTHHVFIEREVLTSNVNEWLVQLYACFQDKDKFYFLLQKVTNGELQRYLEEKGEFLRLELAV